MAEDVVLAQGWNGVNRAVSVADLPEGESPSCQDCAPAERVHGLLGPRRGRSRAYAGTFKLWGVFPFSAPAGRQRITIEDDDWTAEPVVWPDPVVPVAEDLWICDVLTTYPYFNTRIYADPNAGETKLHSVPGALITDTTEQYGSILPGTTLGTVVFDMQVVQLVDASNFIPPTGHGHCAYQVIVRCGIDGAGSELERGLMKIVVDRSAVCGMTITTPRPATKQSIPGMVISVEGTAGISTYFGMTNCSVATTGTGNDIHMIRGIAKREVAVS